jgi:site-specific DNA recombinase
MKKAYLYIRVSTDEQAEKGYSLRHQEERLRHYCGLQNIEIVDLFKEDHSAKTFERPAFKQMLAQMKRSRASANLLLFLKWDRFSRNAGDAYGMIGQLNRLGIEPQAIEQPLDLSVPENKMMLAFYLAAPEVENDRRSLNTIDGMRKALKEGRIANLAPRGYKNARDERGLPIILPGKDADTIRWAFAEIASGNKTVMQVWQVVKERGLKVGRSQMFRLLHNPFYCGRINVPAYRNEPAEVVQGRHEPLVSAHLFNQVQDVMSGRYRRVVPKNLPKEELPLRGFMTCQKCGSNISGSASKGNGGKYFYYHCSRGCNERFKAEEANTLFINELEKIRANEQCISLFETVIRDYAKQGNRQKLDSTKAIQVEIGKHNDRIGKAQQMMVDGDITTAEYREIKQRYEQEIIRLEGKQAEIKMADEGLAEYVSNAAKLLRNLPEYYAGAALPVKQKLIGSILAEKLVFEKNAFRTIKLNEVISLICRTGGRLAENKKGLSQQNEEQSPLVPGMGVEPTLALLQTGF